VIGWAQWVVAVLLVVELFAASVLHGQPRPPTNLSSKILELSVIALLLHAGGFWK